jgi:hypothetical protein
MSLLSLCAVQLSAEEEDRRIAAMGGGQSRLKFKAGDKDEGEGDSWCAHLLSVIHQPSPA